MRISFYTDRDGRWFTAGCTPYLRGFRRTPRHQQQKEHRETHMPAPCGQRSGRGTIKEGSGTLDSQSGLLSSNTLFGQGPLRG